MSYRENQLAVARAEVDKARTWKEKIRLENGSSALLAAAETDLRAALDHLTALRNPAERLHAAQDRLKSHETSRDRLEAEIVECTARLRAAEERLIGVRVQVTDAEVEVQTLTIEHDEWEAAQATAQAVSEAPALDTTVASAVAASALRSLPLDLGTRLAAASRAREDLSDTEPALSESHSERAERKEYVSVRAVEELLQERIQEVLNAVLVGLQPAPRPTAPLEVDVQGRKRRAPSEVDAGAEAYGPPPGDGVPRQPVPLGPEDPLGLSQPDPDTPRGTAHI